MRLLRFLVSAGVLYGIWLGLSGHYTALLLALGAGAAVGASLIAQRAGLLDDEGMPLDILIHLPQAAFWLIGEILRANIATMRVILGFDRAAPRLVKLKALQKGQAALVTHANFITLTPGTVSVTVDDRAEGAPEILVHALTEDFAAGVLDGDMNRRVARLEARR